MNYQTGNKLETANFLGLLKGNNEIYFLDKEINVIGRGKSCNVVLNVIMVKLKKFDFLILFFNCIFI